MARFGGHLRRAQVRHEVRAKRLTLAEYRALDGKDGGIWHGFLVGLGCNIARTIRIGAGQAFATCGGLWRTRQDSNL